MQLNAVIFIVLVLLFPSIVGAVLSVIRHLREAKPPMPNVLLPDGRKVWHVFDNRMHQFQWTGRRWKRTRTRPIDIKELEER